MNKYCVTLILTFIAAWLAIFAIVIVVDPNAVAQTHEDIRSTDSSLDHEKMASGDPDSVVMNDPAAGPLMADKTNISITSHDTPTLLIGKVLGPEDRAIPRTVITLTEADGTKHTTTSDSFGNFRFGEIFGGQQVVLSADASRHSFSDLPVGMAGQTIVSWRAAAK